MSPVEKVIVGLAVWTLVSVAVGLLVAKMIAVGSRGDDAGELPPAIYGEPPAQQSEPAAMPLSGKYGEVLRPFLAMMEAELHANAGKGDRPGWLAMSADTAMLEIYYHVAKLQKAVRHGDVPRIGEHSADVANMAMMVADIFCALITPQAEQCESGDPSCGPVEFRDVEGVPLCRSCYDQLERETRTQRRSREAGLSLVASPQAHAQEREDDDIIVDESRGPGPGASTA